MNVIVANRYQQALQELNVDIIKTMYGEFEVDEIISTFKNLFYQRMILDITAIKNYKNIKNLQKLSISLDMDKIILLLSDDEESSNPRYLSQLVSIGIYNFTRNNEGITYLYNHPNSYRDVAHIHQLDTVVQAPVQTATQPMVNNAPIVNEQIYKPSGPRIIGIKNGLKQSGATTLTYLMKRELEKNYNVLAIEVEKRDFIYFNDKTLVNTNDTSLPNLVNTNLDKDVILVDVNDSKSAEKICTDFVYLVEPSTIKLNKALLVDKKVFEKIKKHRVVLNQSMLDSKDVLDFEREAGIKVFYNMPPLDEREKDIYAVNAFLSKLGFERQNPGQVEEKKKKWGLF